MPLTLRQLQIRHDNCLEKIEEFKTLVNDIGGSYLGNISFNPNEFFNGMVVMSDEEIKSFLSMFPQLPRILELSRQAACEESKRRGFQDAINKALLEKETKMKRLYMGRKKKDRKVKKRLQKLASPVNLSISDSSQEIEDM